MEDKPKRTVARRLREACAEMRRKPFPINDLVPLLQEAADRIDELERIDMESANHVEAVICLRSSRFTGEPPYVGWQGLGKALTEDYDELKQLRVATAATPPPSS